MLKKYPKHHHSHFFLRWLGENRSRFPFEPQLIRIKNYRMVKFAEIDSSRPDFEHQDRYIHKYYLPQELRTSISPADISLICRWFIENGDFALLQGRMPENFPDVVIQYRDIGVKKQIASETVRQMLKAIAAYHADHGAVLTTEENQAAMNLNVWLIEWEKDLLHRCMQISCEMERQVRSDDIWLSDYEIDIETEFYVRDDDPCSEDKLPDGSHGDIDGNIGLLCTIKYLKNLPLFVKPADDGRWHIGDDLDHNDWPRGSRSEKIYNVRHCSTFHELFSHMRMPVKHAGRIGRIYTDIIVKHQNGICIDLKGKRTVAVRDEAGIRKGFESMTPGQGARS